MGYPAIHAAAARQKVVAGDLFSFAHPVVPVKTRGRPYGSISRRIAQAGIRIPELALGNTQYVAPFLFLAQWDEGGACTEDFLFDCGAALMARASFHRLPLIAIPVLGGRGGMKRLWAVEKGLFEQADHLEAAGLFGSQHVYVTDAFALDAEPHPHRQRGA